MCKVEKICMLWSGKDCIRTLCFGKVPSDGGWYCDYVSLQDITKLKIGYRELKERSLTCICKAFFIDILYKVVYIIIVYNVMVCLLYGYNIDEASKIK